MKIFLWIISMMWVTAGIMFLAVPDRMKKFYNEIAKSMKWIAPLPIIFGLLFFWAAPASRLDWAMRILGVMAIIKGVFFLAFPKMTEKFMSWWLNLSPKIYRVFGIFALLLAWMVISSIL